MESPTITRVSRADIERALQTERALSIQVNRDRPNRTIDFLMNDGDRIRWTKISESLYQRIHTVITGAVLSSQFYRIAE